MRRDWPLFFSAFIFLLGATLLLAQPMPGGDRCPVVTTVVQYLPQPEPAPLWPPASLPSFDSVPEATPVAKSEPPPESAAAEEKTMPEVTEEPTRRRHRYHRYHWWRRHH
jgi:hypothetical protein